MLFTHSSTWAQEFDINGRVGAINPLDLVHKYSVALVTWFLVSIYDANVSLPPILTMSIMGHIDMVMFSREELAMT